MAKSVAKRTSVEVECAIAEARENARAKFVKDEKELIVSKYTLPKKPCKDGYYRVYVEDSTKKSGRRQLFAKSLEALADEIYNYEKGKEGKVRKTFAEIFVLVEEKKLRRSKYYKRSSVQNTVSRHQGDYNRFFKGTNFELKYIDEITKNDIENVLEQILTENDLTKKAFDRIVSLLRSVFKFAYKEYITSEDVFPRVEIDGFDGMLSDPIAPSLRAYPKEEFVQIVEYIRNYQETHPTYMPAYALELQILLGSRRSEVLPLEWTDIDKSFIHIRKAQYTIKKTTTVPQHLEIVPTTKNKKPRSFPRTNDINAFLERLENVHYQNNINSKYLFPANTPLGVVTNDSLYEFYRRTIRKLGLKRDNMIMGTHCFRRNAITDIVNETGDAELAAALCGNSARVIKSNYYIDYDYEKALNALNKRKLTD